MSMDAIIFRPLLFLIHTTDIFISHLSSIRTFSDKFVSTDKIPRHVAFSFVTEGETSDVKRRLATMIEELARWASEVGIEEVSLWSKAGLLDDETIELSTFPPISLRQQRPENSTCTDDRIRACKQEEKDSEWITVDLPSDTANSSPETDVSAHSSHVRATRTYAIPSSRYSDKPSQKEVRIHVLPFSTAAGGTIIAQITRKLVEEKVPPEQITQELLDARIRAYLGFTIDPCLLIVQPVSGPSKPRLRKFLPAEPPAIHGYPFWPLRVTEIFLAADRSKSVSEVLDEWTRAVQRWQGVEQRLGR